VFYRKRDSVCFWEVKETELIEANHFTGSADRSAIIEIYKPKAQCFLSCDFDGTLSIRATFGSGGLS
jgi:hypothetical protein